MNKNKKLSILMVTFILMGITFTKNSWGQLGSAITVTHAPIIGAPMDVTFTAHTNNQAAPPHVFPDFTTATYTYPRLSAPYQSFEISAQYVNVNPPYNTVHYDYWVSRATVDAANGSAVYDYSNGAQLTIWSTGLNQYSFRIQRPVGP